MDLRILAQRKKSPELPFPESQGQNARDRASVDRRERILSAMKDFYRGQKRRMVK